MSTEEISLRWDDANTVWKVMYWGRYSYDTAGNMVQRVVYQIVNGNSKSYQDTFAYSRGYQLTSITRGTPAGGAGQVIPINLTYDSNGNVTHIDQNGSFTDSFYDITEMEFDYDAKNRLVKYRFSGAGSWYDIKYDALGRVRERVDLTPTTTKYYLDGRQLIQQLDSSNNVQFHYLRGATGLDRQWNETNDTRRFYIKDNLGTVWAIVNPSDLSVKHYNYNAWGEHLDKDDTDFPTDTNWMRYIGCRVEAFGKGTTTQRDAIYHLDHRYFIPGINMFIQRDPYINSGNMRFPVVSAFRANPYLYALNSPGLFKDPNGLSPYRVKGTDAGVCAGGCPESAMRGEGPYRWYGYEQPPYATDQPPTVGTGDCCRFALMVDSALREGAPFNSIPELIYEYGFNTKSSEPVSAEFPYPYGPGTITCYFDYWFLPFIWYCSWKILCPTKMSHPCYVMGYLHQLESWIMNEIDVGFYWRNREGKAMTRSYLRLDFVRSERLNAVENDWCETAVDIYNIRSKDFCMNDRCTCAKASSTGFSDYPYQWTHLDGGYNLRGPSGAGNKFGQDIRDFP